jgi:ribosomal protein S18 acetylase RimI-like enzyme
MASTLATESTDCSISLEPVTLADVSRCTDIYFAAFQNPHSLACWPRGVPSVRQWWEAMICTELSEEGAFWLKAVSSSSGEILAFAKWVEPKPGILPETNLPAWPAGADAALCTETFGAWAAFHRAHFGPRGHWYLEMVATAPEHQRRGAGSRLIRWGLARADAAGWEAYLEASPEARALYEKLGFVVVGATETRIAGELYRNEYMVRQPRPREGGPAGQT